MEKFYKKPFRWPKGLQKAGLAAAFMLGGVGLANAQVSSYTFSQSMAGYTEISGGTILGTATGNTSIPI